MLALVDPGRRASVASCFHLREKANAPGQYGISGHMILMGA